jgi:hypothetical protein
LLLPTNSRIFGVIGLTVDDRVILIEDGGTVSSICTNGTDLKILAEHINSHSVSISPDGKYLAYKTPDPIFNQPFDIPRGVFILNLETGDSVFYEVFPSDNRYAQFHIVSWTKKSGVDALITAGNH